MVVCELELNDKKKNVKISIASSVNLEIESIIRLFYVFDSVNTIYHMCVKLTFR